MRLFVAQTWELWPFHWLSIFADSPEPVSNIFSSKSFKNRALSLKILQKTYYYRTLSKESSAKSLTGFHPWYWELQSVYDCIHIRILLLYTSNFRLNLTIGPIKCWNLSKYKEEKLKRFILKTHFIWWNFQKTLVYWLQTQQNSRNSAVTHK